MPQVSVIIPTHDRAEHLQKAIASVLNQTFRDLEVIVVDDASSDGTREVVAALTDSRVRYFRHDSQRGGSAARNTGVINSSSKYVAFLDDDDEWLPDKLAKQMDIILVSPQQVGCVYTGYWDVDRATGTVIGQQIPTKRGNLSKDLLAENCIGSASSVLLKRECIDKVGLFDESLPCSQDYDLWIRIANEFHFECVQESLFKYFIHGNRISTDPEARARGLEIMRNKYRGVPISRRYFSDAYNDLGIKHCLVGDTKAGRAVFLKAIKSSPMRIRGYFNFCLSFLGAKNFKRVKETRQRLSTSS